MSNDSTCGCFVCGDKNIVNIKTGETLDEWIERTGWWDDVEVPKSSPESVKRFERRVDEIVMEAKALLRDIKS